MRVEVHHKLGRLHRSTPANESEKPVPQRLSRRDRKLQWTALALFINEMIVSGKWENYAEASRSCRVSRARITKLMAQPGPVSSKAQRQRRDPNGTATRVPKPLM